MNYETINQVSNFCLFAHNISDKYINYVLAGPGTRCDEGAEQGCLVYPLEDSKFCRAHEEY